jgi:hypothetical protein
LVGQDDGQGCVHSDQIGGVGTIEYETGEYQLQLTDCSHTSPLYLHAIYDSEMDTQRGAIFGGDENPLLRGGLAMASFAVEALNLLGRYDPTDPDRYSRAAHGSVQHALKLLDYVEACEYIDPDGVRTGFFLRSRCPGDREMGREFWFASTDEIVGMTLGLYYLHKALAETGDVGNQQRVEDLVHRLGTRMKENYYFLVPLRRRMEKVTVVFQGNNMTVPGFGTGTPFRIPDWLLKSGYPQGIEVEIEVPRWVPIEGLPQERQKGWMGGFFLQWFLAGGFRAITDQNYRPHDPLLRDDYGLPRDMWEEPIESGRPIYHPFWATVCDLTLIADEEEEDPNYAEACIPFDSLERAVLGIQVLGAAMYEKAVNPDGKWKLSIDLGIFPDKEFPIPMDKIQVERWNLAMLLHAFQLGMANKYRDPQSIHAVKHEMARLIKGILHKEGAETSINLRKFATRLYSTGSWKDVGGTVLSYIWDAFCDTVETLPVGTPTEDHDIYAAVVARLHNLHVEYTVNHREREFLKPFVPEAHFSDAPTWYFVNQLSPIERTMLENAKKRYEEEYEEYEDAIGLAFDGRSEDEIFAPDLPVGERRRLIDFDSIEYTIEDVNEYFAKYCSGYESPGKVVQDHNPGRYIGAAFMWEHGIKEMQDGGKNGNNGLYDFEILNTYTRRSITSIPGAPPSCVDMMREGAGLDWFLPMALLGHLDWPTVNARVNWIDAPYLDGGTPMPGQLAKENNGHWDAYGQRCFPGFKPPGLPPDIYENLETVKCWSEMQRNDSFLTATELTWGLHEGLTLDRSTHPDYENIPYGVYTHSGQEGEWLSIEQDYDYYILVNDTGCDLRVTLNPGNVTMWLAVDGGEFIVPEAVMIGSSDGALLDIPESQQFSNSHRPLPNEPAYIETFSGAMREQSAFPRSPANGMGHHLDIPTTDPENFDLPELPDPVDLGRTVFPGSVRQRLPVLYLYSQITTTVKARSTHTILVSGKEAGYYSLLLEPVSP